MPKYNPWFNKQVQLHLKVARSAKPLKGWKLASTARKALKRYDVGSVVKTLLDGSYVVQGPERVRPGGNVIDFLLYGYDDTVCWLSEYEVSTKGR